MRCPDCGKFVSLELQEPELVDSDLDGSGVATFTVRIVRTCAECSQELKEATLDMEVDCTDAMEAHEKDKHDGQHNAERFEMADEDLETVEESGHRYKASRFGAKAGFDLVCTECNETVDHLECSETVEASAMEELV